MRLLLLVPLALMGCAEEPGKAPSPNRNTNDTLEVPDLSGIDFPAAYSDALRLASTVVASTPWDTHVDLLAQRSVGCPDVYAGIPDGDIDELDEDMGGTSWSDFCESTAGETWSGFAWWDSIGQASTNLDYPDITLESGSRELIADATITTDAGALWEFDGSASEGVNYTNGPGYSDWTWSSLIEGTFTGSVAFDGTDTPSGWRTDLYLEAAKGDTGDAVEARGNIYLFDARLHGRFDSMVMDLEFLGANNLGPDGCPDEPLGWIGLRDEDAIWYDLVFLPRTEGDIVEPPYDNPLSTCDGCGTLYVRGVESGEICVDLGFVLDGLIEPPDVDSFVLPLRGLPEPQ